MEKRTAFEHGIIYRNTDTFFRYNGWASVCKDDEGTLYAVWSGARAWHVCPFGKTLMSKSTDGGKRWSMPMIINDTWLDDRDAGVICLGGKKLLVSWFTHPVESYLGNKWLHDTIIKAWPGSESALGEYVNIPADAPRGGSNIRVSDEDGIGWGEQIWLPISAPHGPILRRDGSLLYLGKEMWCHDKDLPDVVLAMESRDEGKTWTELGRVPLPEVEGIQWDHLHEPHVAELPDGTLIGMIRGHHPGFTLYQTVSHDGGRTWSVPVHLGVNGAPPHVLVHSSGAVITTFGRRAEPFGERAIVSYDGGRTWPDEYILRDDAPNGDLGYPATVELDDGSLLTVYYQVADEKSEIPTVGEGEYPSIMYTKWTL